MAGFPRAMIALKPLDGGVHCTIGGVGLSRSEFAALASAAAAAAVASFSVEASRAGAPRSARKPRKHRSRG